MNQLKRAEVIKLLASGEWVKASSISKSISMSESSVRHDMPEIRKAAEAIGARIEASNKFGYRLTADERQISELLRSYGTINGGPDYEERRRYMVSILFKKNAVYTVQLFANDLGVGRNVILNDLDYLESWLAFHSLRLVRRRSAGLSVTGNEYNKRMALMESMKNRHNVAGDVYAELPGLDERITERFYRYYRRVFPDCDLIFMQNLMLETEKLLETRFTSVPFMQLIELISISSVRIREGYIIGESEYPTTRFATVEAERAARYIFNSIFPGRGDELKYEKALLAERTVGYMSAENVRVSTEIERYYHDTALRLVRDAEIIIGCTFLERDELVRELAVLFVSKHLNGEYRPMKNPVWVNDIEKNLAPLCILFSLFYSELGPELEMAFSHSDIAATAIRANEHMPHELKPRRVKALFINNEDKELEKYLEFKIKAAAPEIELTTMTPDRLLQNIEEFDLVISNYVNYSANALRVQRILKDEDLANICEAVDKIKRRKDLEHTYGSEFIKSVVVSVQPDITTRGKLMNYLSTALWQHGWMPQNEFSPHAIKSTPLHDRLIVLADGKFVKKSGILVVQSNSGIEWPAHMKVKTVYAIMISSADYDLRSKIFSAVFHLSKDLHFNRELFNRGEAPKAFDWAPF